MAAACATIASAQTATREHAAIRLIAEDENFQPGRVAWVGLLFELEPGWHIYWVNPGDAGDPPQVKWDLPAGFAMGEFRWPVPGRFETGPVVDYGYEHRVLLAAPLSVPSSYRPAAPAPIGADIRYVICRDVCISATARATLPGQPGPGSSLAERRATFAETRARWPKAMPAAWNAAVRAEGERLILTIDTGARETGAQFFPLDEGQVDNAGRQIVVPTPRGIQVSLPRAEPDAPAPKTLRGVIVLGADRAFSVESAVAGPR